MITARLNNLIRAYQIAKQQLGDANRGKAIPAICMRRLQRLRPVVMAELKLVAGLVNLMRRGELKREGDWMQFPSTALNGSSRNDALQQGTRPTPTRER